MKVQVKIQSLKPIKILVYVSVSKIQRMNLNENHIMSFHLNCILDNYLIQQYIPYHKSRFLYVGFYCMVCSQIAPWHGPSPKQIKHEQFDLYLILLDKLFLGDNEVSVKLGEDLHKKIHSSAFLRDYWEH